MKSFKKISKGIKVSALSPKVSCGAKRFCTERTVRGAVDVTRANTGRSGNGTAAKHGEQCFFGIVYRMVYGEDLGEVFWLVPSDAPACWAQVHHSKCDERPKSRVRVSI